MHAINWCLSLARVVAPRVLLPFGADWLAVRVAWLFSNCRDGILTEAHTHLSGLSGLRFACVLLDRMLDIGPPALTPAFTDL